MRVFSRAVLGVALWAAAAVAAPPAPLLTYSGQLLDPAGKPVTSAKLLHFKLYDAADNGAVVYSQDTNITPDANGNFSVVLGGQPALAPSAFNKPLWLGIQVESDLVEMKPRLQLTSAPYALTADWATLTGMPAGFADDADDGLTAVAHDLAFTGTGSSSAPLSADLTVLQARLGALCAPGFYTRGFAQDGAATCEADKTTQLADGGTMQLVNDVLAVSPLTSTGGPTPQLALRTAGCVAGSVLKLDAGVWGCAGDLNSGGTVTAITAGAGLTGGVITAAGTIGLAATVQNWASQPTCPVGQNLRAVSAAGVPTCQADANSGGTVTSVIAGAGLTGGTITGAGTIALAATVQNWASQPTCPLGQNLRSVSAAGVPTCQADADSGGTVTAVTASAPLVSSGGATPNLTLTSPLPVANGGTGSATKSWVDLTTAQTIAGNKTFSGNIGVGTVAPVADLDFNLASPFVRLNSTDTALYSRIFMMENGANAAAIQQIGSTYMTASRQRAFELLNLTPAGPITMWTNGAERVRLTAGGTLGIGTTAPLATTALHVTRDATGGNSVARFENTNAMAANYSTGILVTDGPARTVELDLWGATSTTFPAHAGYAAVVTNGTAGLELASTSATGALRFFPAGLANERMRIDSAGNVGIGTNAPASLLHVSGGCITGSFCSDARLKTDVRPLREPVLDRVMKLEPSTYRWKSHEESTRRIGMIAQQVEQVFPEVVTSGNQLGLECTGLAAIALQAIKEQQAQLKQQQAQLSALQQELRALRSKR